MDGLERIKIHRVVKDQNSVQAVYTGVIKERYLCSTDEVANHYIGDFSYAEWRKIAFNRALYSVVNHMIWLAPILAIVSLTAAFTVFSDSVTFGLLSFGLFFVLLFVTVAELGTRLADDVLGEIILKKFNLIPSPVDSEISISDFVDVDEDVFIDHLKKASQEEFVNIVKSFDRWRNEKETYSELDDTVGYRSDYTDKDLYDFVTAKRGQMYKKVRANEAEARELSNRIKQGIHRSKLVQALQKTDEILAG